jgi:hypothetical protein
MTYFQIFDLKKNKIIGNNYNRPNDNNNNKIITQIISAINFYERQRMRKKVSEAFQVPHYLPQ